MRNINKLIYLLMLLCISCTRTNKEETEKYQNKRDNIINLKDEIIDIETNVLYGRSSLYIIEDILVVEEFYPKFDKGIHFFNKNTFKYITSTAIIGKGPDEVTRQGGVAFNKAKRVLWVSDHGKKVMWKFHLDSILNNERYKATEKIDLYDELFIERYGFLNDSIALGKAVHIIGSGKFEMAMSRLNLNKNLTRKYGYEHPMTVEKKSNSCFKLSVENELYINCYAFSDLMTICDLEGKLKYNIYGPDWLKNKNNRNDYFRSVDIISNHIIAAYIGDVGVVYDEFKRPHGNLPTKFLVFDLDGTYKNTIEIGHHFTSFCVDEENSRVIIYFDDRENPLGYINLNLD